MSKYENTGLQRLSVPLNVHITALTLNFCPAFKVRYLHACRIKIVRIGYCMAPRMRKVFCVMPCMRSESRCRSLSSITWPGSRATLLGDAAL